MVVARICNSLKWFYFNMEPWLKMYFTYACINGRYPGEPGLAGFPLAFFLYFFQMILWKIIIILWAGVQPTLDPYAEAFIAGPLR